MQGNEKGYKDWMRLMPSNPASPNDEDIQADIEYRQSRIPLPELIKSRVLFDGGNYSEAFKFAQNSKPENLEHSLEKEYRLGRCTEALQQSQVASIHYKKVIREGSQSTEYFAASAAWQLALYYQKLGKTDSVNYYCNLVETLPNQAYKKSLSMKARALKNNNITK
jgi:tetratricopeptide (TPR) repeat protein